MENLKIGSSISESDREWLSRGALKESIMIMDTSPETARGLTGMKIAFDAVVKVIRERSSPPIFSISYVRTKVSVETLWDTYSTLDSLVRF